MTHKNVVLLLVLFSTLLVPVVSAGPVLFQEQCNDPMSGWDNHEGFGAGGSPTVTIQSAANVCNMDVTVGSCSSDCWANVEPTEAFNVPAFDGITLNATIDIENSVASTRYTMGFFNDSTVRSTLLANNTGNFAQSLRGDAATDTVYVILQQATPTVVVRSISGGAITQLDTFASDDNPHNYQLWINATHVTFRYDGTVTVNTTHTCSACSAAVFAGVQNIATANIGSGQSFDEYLIFRGQEDPEFPSPPSVSANYSVNVTNFNNVGSLATVYNISVDNGTFEISRNTTDGFTVFPELKGSTLLADFNFSGFLPLRNINLSFDSNNQSNTSAWQSETGFSAQAIVSGVPLTFNFTTTSLGTVQRANDVNSFVVRGQTNSFTINANASGFNNLVFTASAPSAKEQRNITLNFSIGNINVTAVDALGGTDLSTFTVKVSSSDYPSFSVDEATSVGFVDFDYINATYTIDISASGFNDQSIVKSFGLGEGDLDIQFNMSPSNSLFARIFDEITKAPIMNGTLEVLSDDVAINVSTLTGNFSFDDLVADNYTLRYFATDYPQRLYFFDLQNGTSTNLSLFLLTTGNSTLIDANVKDQNFDTVQGVIIQALRFFVGTNTYEIVQMVATDFDGNAQMNLQLNEEFYKFILVQDGVVRSETIPTFITDTMAADGVNFRINTEVNVLQQLQDLANVFTSLTFNNATQNFRYEFVDTGGNVIDACLTVTQANSFGSTQINQTCVSTSSATILIPISGSGGGTFIGSANLTDGTNDVFVGSTTVIFSESKEVYGFQGAFYAFLVFGTLAIIGARRPKMLMIFSPVGMLIAAYFGVFAVSITLMFTLAAVAVIVVGNMRESSS